ncbi:MAG: hypothetical protein Q4F60_01055 [Candidatus Saccharibacteria bacterium]|nr:hypothetical protein [Candidatus Saccharibacteria bacterium]
MKKKGEGKNSDNSKREEILQKAGAYSAVFFMAFFVALVSASAFTPVDKTNAEDINVGVDSTGYYVNVASSSSVDLDVTAVAGGQVVIGTDQITTKSNCEGGFRVYMSVDSDTYDGLYLNGDTTEANKFNASSGTPTQPIKLATNTWGWAIPKVGESTYGFNTEYIDSNGNSSTGATGQSIMNISDQLFAGVPKIGNEVLVQSYDAAAVSGRTQKIYYDVNATTALTSGNYTGKVIYTAVADAGKGGTTEKIGISPAEGGANGGDTVTVSTDIYSTMPDDKLLSDFSVKIDGRDCTLTGVSRTTSGSLNFQCITPAMASDDEVDVALTSAVFGRTWSLADGYTYLPATFDGIKNMQDMSSAICAAETTPTKDAKTPTKSSSTAASDPTTYVPETRLTDTRDGSTYLVRKLADGNCWMTEDLLLTLNTTKPLTSVDSDINYNMDTGEGLDGTTTEIRQVTNPLDTYPLGIYSTDANGKISWTPYANSQTIYESKPEDRIGWGSIYSGNDNCSTILTDGIATSALSFKPGTADKETQHAGNYMVYNKCSEYARSYSNHSNGQSGTGTRATNLKIEDGDGIAQFYGTQYTWYAATAGSGTYSMESGEAVNSICPANWQLPNNEQTDTKSFYNLFITTYGLNESIPSDFYAAMSRAPFSFIRQGAYQWSGGSLSSRGEVGDYWTREANGQGAYRIQFSMSSIQTQYSYNKVSGFAVRCVAH